MVRAFAHGAMGRQISPPLSCFSFKPVFHDWCNKGRGMCYPVIVLVNIKVPLLLIGKMGYTSRGALAGTRNNSMGNP